MYPYRSCTRESNYRVRHTSYTEENLLGFRGHSRQAKFPSNQSNRRGFVDKDHWNSASTTGNYSSHPKCSSLVHWTEALRADLDWEREVEHCNWPYRPQVRYKRLHCKHPCIDRTQRDTRHCRVVRSRHSIHNKDRECPMGLVQPGSFGEPELVVKEVEPSVREPEEPEWAELVLD